MSPYLSHHPTDRSKASAPGGTKRACRMQNTLAAGVAKPVTPAISGRTTFCSIITGSMGGHTAVSTYSHLEISHLAMETNVADLWQMVAAA